MPHDFVSYSKQTQDSMCCASSLGQVWLFATPWTAASQASLSFTISQSLLRFMSIESVMLSNHLILCCSLLLLPSISASIRVFSSELGLQFRCPSIGASASVLTDLISLPSQELSRVFSSTIKPFSATVHWATLSSYVWNWIKHFLLIEMILPRRQG